MDRALALPRAARPSPLVAARRLRLMIVVDSMVARATLSRTVEADDRFEIAAIAASAGDAIDALGAVRVDVILLDLATPGAGVLSAIPRIAEAARGARILIALPLADEGARTTTAALALGAADTLTKPGTGRYDGRISDSLLRKLEALGPSGPGVAASARGPACGSLRAMPGDPIEVVAIGASTGGIHALGLLFEHLPQRIGVPILVTQHLPAAFMGVFARQLGSAAQRPALVAEDRAELAADRILIAPGDAHLTVERFGRTVRVRLSDGPAASGCRPSVDPMLASVGHVYGPGAVGVVLSGMGRDGAQGAARLVALGGSVIAQDQASCAVWGMPRGVFEAGLACAVLPPDRIARRIAARVARQTCT